MKTYKKRSRARQQQRPSSPSEDKEENENDTEKEVITEAKTPEAKKEEGNSSKSKPPKKGTKSSFDSANSSNGGGGNGGTYDDDDDDDDDNFVAERLTAKRTKASTETKQSPNKSTDSNADTTDTEYKKFVEEQRKYFDSLDGYSLTVEKDLSASGPKKGKRKSLVSPIKPNEEAGSGGSLPPSAKKRKTGQQQQRQQQQLGFISPIKSGNSSLSRTGKSGDRGPEDENSYDDSFDREIESEFMSQSKSKSRIENSFDSLAMSPIKK